MKTCTKCGEAKPLREFPKEPRNVDGHQAGCKECRKKSNREWRDRTRAENIARGAAAVEKLCPCCDTVKPASEFYKNACARSGLDSYCKLCSKDLTRKLHKENHEKISAYRREYRDRNRDAIKAKQREKTTGFTTEMTVAAVMIQDGLCAICKTPLVGLDPRKTHADHCHVTGRARGILCHSCNIGLGMFSDNPTRLQAAIDYLKNPPLGIL